MDKNTIRVLFLIIVAVMIYFFGMSKTFIMVTVICALRACCNAYGAYKYSQMSPEVWRNLPKNNKVNLSREKKEELLQPTEKVAKLLVVQALFLFFVAYLGAVTDKSVLSLIIGTVSGISALNLGIVNEIIVKSHAKSKSKAEDDKFTYIFLFAVVFVLLVIQ